MKGLLGSTIYNCCQQCKRISHFTCTGLQSCTFSLVLPFFFLTYRYTLFAFTFTISCTHLADAFIQSDLQVTKYSAIL